MSAEGVRHSLCELCSLEEIVTDAGDLRRLASRAARE
jgi:hypothetical protein